MKINKIHHVAHRCKDAKETVEWYGKYLNMDFVLAIAKGLDMIAASVRSARYIFGEPQSWVRHDLDAETVVLSRDGQIVNRGTGADAQGNQWQSNPFCGS